MKKIGLAAVVIMVVFFGVTGIVKSAENRELAVACAEREQSEAMFVQEVRKMLNESGYENSGINLSRVTGEKEGWVYTVRIHHNKLKDNEEKCDAFIRKMESFADWDACEGLKVEFF